MLNRLHINYGERYGRLLRRARIWAMIVLSAAACSCSDEPVTPPVEPVGHATLIYMPWSASESSSTGSLYESFLRNIADIETAIVAEGGLHGTRLLVSISKSYNNMSLLEITFDGTRCRRDTLKRYANPQYSDASWLTSLFSDMAAAAPAESYSMIIGAHGSGWLPVGARPERSRAFGGRTASAQASVETLARAITESALRHTDFVCFDDCYMSNVETAYALRHATHYLIASTSEVMDPGLPYASAWKHLYSEPDFEAVCRVFNEYYRQFWLPYGTLSTVDCTRIEDLATLMRDVNDEIEVGDERLSQVQKLDGFAKTVFYDMAHYVESVCDNEAKVSALRSAIANAVVATSCTPRLYSVYLTSLDHTYPVATSCGLTISDPTGNSAAFEAKYGTEWWVATHR